MTARARLLAIFVIAVTCSTTTATAGATTLSFDGIGPLKLGMTRSKAVETSWLSNRGTGCPLRDPVSISYKVRGRKAPRDVRGYADFNDGTLTNLSFYKGVRTTTGVRVGRTTAKRMARVYRKRGYRVRSLYLSMFGGTFVTVYDRNDNPLIGGFARAGKKLETLAIPLVQVCE